MKTVSAVSLSMNDRAEVCLEIIKLIKNSPKGYGIFEGMELGGTTEAVSREDLESINHDQINGESLVPLKLKTFCTKRSTLRHSGFQRVCMSFKDLLKLWAHTFPTEKGLKSDIKEIISGVSAKTNFFISHSIYNWQS